MTIGSDDFGRYSTGDLFAVGDWSHYHDHGFSWTVVNDNVTTGQAAESSPGTAGELDVAAWETSGEIAVNSNEFQLTAIYEQGIADAAESYWPGVAFRVAGDETSPEGYAVIMAGGVELQLYDLATGNTLTAEPVGTAPASEPAAIRVEVDGTGTRSQEIRARVWEWGTTEPTTWHIDTTDDTHTSQLFTGLTHYTDSTGLPDPMHDWIGMGSSGDTAPLPDVGQDIDLSASGTATGTGSAQLDIIEAGQEIDMAASGVMTGTGDQAGISALRNGAASGMVSGTGTASVSALRNASAAGAMAGTGTAALGVIHPIAASGSGVGTGSAAAAGAVRPVSASGAGGGVGTGVLARRANASATGTLTATGRASLITGEAVDLAASGALTGMGTAALARTRGISAGGEFVGEGAAVISVYRTASASGQGVGMGQAVMGAQRAVSAAGAASGIGQGDISSLRNASAEGALTGSGVATSAALRNAVASGEATGEGTAQMIVSTLVPLSAQGSLEGIGNADLDLIRSFLRATEREVVRALKADEREVEHDPDAEERMIQE